jgi:hypothetical protein
MRPVQFHSIIIANQSDAVMRNHRAYCDRMGYAHDVHRMSSPENSTRSRLLYKYSVAHKALAGAPKDALLIFADESAVIYAPVRAEQVIGAAPYWIAQSVGGARPDGNFFIVDSSRVEALAMLDTILDRLRSIPESGTDRWSHAELEGFEAHPFGTPVDGANCANLLFTAFGHNLPEYSAYVLSLNPMAHPNAHDDRLNRIFVEYLNDVQSKGERLYADVGLVDTDLPAEEVVTPGRPVALLTMYTPNIASYAAISERNVTAYCRKHGYTHYIYRRLPADLDPRVAGNWIKAQLMLRHLHQHEQLAWIDADILIHDLSRPLDAITRGAPITLARDISGHEFNSGFMVFARCGQASHYLEEVQRMIDAVPDKSSVYASGSDQRFFVEAWKQAGGHAAIPLSDSVTCNSHPALHDADTFMLHYMGYADRFRALVMRHDLAQIEARETASSPAP